MNLPNSLTLTRIFLVPLLVVVLLTKFEGRHVLGVPKEIIGAVIFAIASLTDWADGYLARRRKQITPLGQVIDPLADKLLTIAALISLVQMDLAQSWMVAVIVGRELAVTTLRSLAYARGVAMPASPLGKIKMVAQVIAILALILAHGGGRELYLIGQGALWVVVITALVSGADYFRRFNLVLAPRMPDVRTPRDRRTDRRAG
ncbi:MAG: CDP-diacylglycerol--glycerol-3-phosphate 3-phosphatidyltransferase [Acidobacteria bacterium RIFCSPLOWO2_12_FULL_66_10]|nr:MAG: CDP-diacylglycerol--glycerol-3-phosphate 3-phosphatidyltransferase [Acidobacteria bacterium RIFCSPLOWO2_12_FULL_66_10]